MNAGNELQNALKSEVRMLKIQIQETNKYK